MEVISKLFLAFKQSVVQAKGGDLSAESVLLVDTVQESNLPLLLTLFQISLGRLTRSVKANGIQDARVVLLNLESNWNGYLNSIKHETCTDRLTQVIPSSSVVVEQPWSVFSLKKDVSMEKVVREIAPKGSLVVIDSFSHFVETQGSLEKTLGLLRRWRKIYDYRLLVLWHKDLQQGSSAACEFGPETVQNILTGFFQIVSVAEPLIENVLERYNSDAKLLVAASKSGLLALSKGGEYNILNDSSKSANVQRLLWKQGKGNFVDDKYYVDWRLQKGELFEQFVERAVERSKSSNLEVWQSTEELVIHQRQPSKLKTTPKVDPPAGEDALASLTFNLQLTEQQKEARSNLVLPYESVSHSPSSRSGGRVLCPERQAHDSVIWYDAAVDDDDFDEEDPDDDLVF